MDIFFSAGSKCVIYPASGTFVANVGVTRRSQFENHINTKEVEHRNVFWSDV